MGFAISPVHRLDHFPNGLELKDKIEVFIERVRGWQIQPALEMIWLRIPHRGFAQLHIVLSYFEMIGKYRAGFIGQGQSKQYFREGFAYTFPDIPEGNFRVHNALYKGVRNGLYHVGMIEPNVLLYDGIPGSIGFNEQRGLLAISPDRFVNDISIRFDAYANELRDEANAKLRRNFEARFDNRSEG